MDHNRKTTQKFQNSKEGVGDYREMNKMGTQQPKDPSQPRGDFSSWAGRKSQHNVQSQRGQGASEVILWF